jgi:hypothetical protein
VQRIREEDAQDEERIEAKDSLMTQEARVGDDEES